jgi:hypothetical protein
VNPVEVFILLILCLIIWGCFSSHGCRYFSDKIHLFHEVEYAHIIIFYVGLGLIVQGLALAIVNKELKAVWKYSTEQSLEEMAEQIEKTKLSFMGEFKVKYGVWTDVKRHLDIHLVRIKFLEVMNLPNNFAYNE